ncbi:MAG: VWA domain-containing protein [Gammaproteobacteria bacterium]|nr:VWA domain-containing protein [Gammaproteobacteria bacterium]
MKRRRKIEGVSVAFIDVISCGFGALILLLVLTKVFEPVVIEQTMQDLTSYLARLQEELLKIKGETRELNREMLYKEDMVTTRKERLARVKGELAALNKQYESTSQSTNITNLIEGKLAQAKQSLTKEMKRLLADYKKDLDNDTIGGIPVDSEYVIFIIDTSGSMFNYAWPLVRQKVEETLDVYPRLKGIQVMNDMGNYMFTQYTNNWIPDTPARRAAILKRLETWNSFSNSSPVEGITKAIATFYRPDRKISLYVFGDEFSGRSIQRVVDAVDRINREDAEGNRLVRIHAIGFPVQFANPPQYQDTGIKFAILMRILCARNGGTFVGLHDFRLL